MIWILLIGIAAIIVGFGAFFGAPYVPSKRREIQAIFKQLYKLSAKDVVLDIGSGDGIVLREASRMGARAIGVEINPFFVILSRILSRRDPKVRVIASNLWLYHFPEDITVVYAFAVERDGRRLERKLQREADRLGKKLTLLCFGSPLPRLVPTATYRAYARYDFHPLHPGKAQV